MFQNASLTFIARAYQTYRTAKTPNNLHIFLKESICADDTYANLNNQSSRKPDDVRERKLKIRSLTPADSQPEVAVGSEIQKFEMRHDITSPKAQDKQQNRQHVGVMKARP